MKTAILYALVFILGAAAGSVVTGYAANRVHERMLSFQAATDLGSAAMQAELIKLGETAAVLGTLERTIPLQVIAIHENEALRSGPLADTALMGAKRYYVCTRTPMSPDIETILEPIQLSENACRANANTETAVSDQ